MRVAALHPSGVLMCGFDAINERAFCKLIKLGHNLDRLLTCTRIDIKGVGYYPRVEQKICRVAKKPYPNSFDTAILQQFAFSSKLA